VQKVLPNKILNVVLQSEDNLRLIRNSDTVEIRGWIVWEKSGPRVLDKKVDGAEEIQFVFDQMNYGFWRYLEENIVDTNTGFNEKDVIMTYNFTKMKIHILRWLLKDWSLPIPLERKESGELTDECIKRVMGVHPRIIGYFLDKFESRLFIDEEEKRTISRQTTLLFHPKSAGVSNACSAVAMYCTLSSFWEKFGLNFWDIQNLPQEIFVRLKLVLGNEIEIKSSQSKQVSRPQPHHKGRPSKGGRISNKVIDF